MRILIAQIINQIERLSKQDKDSYLRITELDMSYFHISP